MKPQSAKAKGGQLMTKHFQAWLWVTASILWASLVFGLLNLAVVSPFMVSKPLYLFTLIATLLAPMLLYGIYNILRYVYETTVSKS